MHPYPSYSMYSLTSSFPQAVPQSMWYSFQAPQVYPYFQGNIYNSTLPQEMFPYPTPYPRPYPMLNTKSPGVQTILSQFKTADGNIDINKMMNTMGQVVNAVNQVSSLVKGLSQTFKL